MPSVRRPGDSSSGSASCRRPLLPSCRRLRVAAILSACVWLQLCHAQVRRPATNGHSLTFEDLSSICDFAEGTPISDEYAARLATFSGPGFGSLNGGVPAHACALAAGTYPPLGNASFAGSGFLAFSTLHAFHGRTGKPVGPQTIRFDVRMTNLRVSFAGIDGHEALVELWSGSSLSYNDRGELLASFRLPMTAELQSFDLVDENVRLSVTSRAPRLLIPVSHRPICTPAKPSVASLSL